MLFLVPMYCNEYIRFHPRPSGLGTMSAFGRTHSGFLQSGMMEPTPTMLDVRDAPRAQEILWIKGSMPCTPLSVSCSVGAWFEGPEGGGLRHNHTLPVPKKYVVWALDPLFPQFLGSPILASKNWPMLEEGQDCASESRRIRRECRGNIRMREERPPPWIVRGRPFAIPPAANPGGPPDGCAPQSGRAASSAT